MPYYLSKETEGCKGKWAVVDSSGKLYGCHDTKEKAVAQMVAVSLQTREPIGGTYPPERTNEERRGN